MATVIRLKRGGRRHVPYYRVVVMDSRGRARGREVDQIGFYHPCGRPQPIAEIDGAKALDWLRKGARPTDTVRGVLSKKGIMAAFAANQRSTVASAAAESPAAEVAEESPAGVATE